MKISLVIPTCNKLSRLKLVLASLARQTYPREKWETIIVDDGSTDGTETYIGASPYGLPIRYIRKANQGRAAARNSGLAAARNELVIFIDDDVILSPEFIAAHAALQQGGGGVVHGRIVNLSYLKFFEDPSEGILYPYLEGKNQKWEGLKSKCITEEDILHRFSEKVGRQSSLTDMEATIQRVLTLPKPELSWIGFTGGNVSARRAQLEAAGGFDEAFGRNWGCEDLELGYRLVLSKVPIRYSEMAVNYHVAHYRAGYVQEHAITGNYFFQKHKDPNILHFQRFVEGELSGWRFLEEALSSTSVLGNRGRLQ